VKIGSLCTGYGGIEMGLALAGVAVSVAWVAEIDPDLAALHTAPNLGDITAVDWAAIRSGHGPIDLLTAGFPCQPVSAAGRQRGEDDHRWLWPYVRDAIATLRPPQVLLENVRNLISIGKGALWEGILHDLAHLGYDVRWLTLGACHVGAAHHRHRVFALATLATRDGWLGGLPAQHVATSTCGAKAGAVLPTPAAVSYGSNQGGAAGRVGPVRHSLDSLARLDLLPTPAARDGDHRGEGDQRYWSARAETRTNGMPLGAAVALLPTPQSRDGQGRGTPSAETAEARFDAGRRNIDDALALLPTPTSSEHTGAGYAADGGLNLRTAVTLLPTPRAGDAALGASYHNNRGEPGAIASAVQPEHWGRFAEAVARHEAIYGPAPAPTEPNRNGAPRLAPAFAEWLMCLPAGHVTARLDRVPALRAIGNGVCPPQVAAAWRLLTGEPVDVSLGAEVGSATMTQEQAEQPTSPTRAADIAFIADRAADQCRAIWAAHDAADQQTPDARLHAAGLVAALHRLAELWRAEAEWWQASNRKGRVSTAQELRQSAARLAGVAVKLEQIAQVYMESIDTAIDKVMKLDQPPQVRGVLGGAVEDYLTGKTDTYQPTDLRPGWASGDTITVPVVPAEAPEHKIGDTVNVAGIDFTKIGNDPFAKTPYIERPDGIAEALDRAVDTLHGTTLEADAPANPFVAPGAPSSAPVKPCSWGDLSQIAERRAAVREHFSHSAVSTYESCSLQLLLSDASREGALPPRRPAWSLVGGGAFHKAIERIERDYLLGIVWPLSGVETLWTEVFEAAIVEQRDSTLLWPVETWYAANGGKEGYDWWRVEGGDMIRRYIDHHDAQRRAAFPTLHVSEASVAKGVMSVVPVIELPFTMDVEGVQSQGFIDFAVRGASQHDWEELTVIDWKSGRQEPSEHIQMAEYAWALHKLHGPARGPIWGSYWMARKGEYTPPVNLLADYPWAEVAYRFRSAARGYAAGVFTPHVTNLCVACGSRASCPAGSR